MCVNVKVNKGHLYPNNALYENKVIIAWRLKCSYE